jgi:hypothetical protein
VDERNVNPQKLESGFTIQTGGNRSGPQIVGLELVPVDDLSPHSYASAGPDGGTVNNVNPGRYTIRFHPQSAWYVDSASQGSTDLLRDTLVVTASAEQQPIALVLRNDSASLTPKLQSDNSEASATLLLIPDLASSSIQTMQISQSGRKFGNLRPGSYTLLAFDDIEDLAYAEPGALDHYLPHATRVTLNANDDKTVSVTLIHRDDEGQ